MSNKQEQGIEVYEQAQEGEVSGIPYHEVKENVSESFGITKERRKELIDIANKHWRNYKSISESLLAIQHDCSLNQNEKVYTLYVVGVNHGQLRANPIAAILGGGVVVS